MQHRFLVEVNEVERLCAIAPFRSANRNIEILGVTGSRCDRNRDARECRSGRIVQVSGDDGANIRATNDSRESVLIAQFDEYREVQNAWNRRVVERQYRAMRCGSCQFVGQPIELSWTDFTVVFSRHG